MVSHDKLGPGLVNSNEDLDELGHHVHYWSSSYHYPSINILPPSKKTRNSSLRIATITSERLYHGLRFEAELFPLNPQNWQYILRFVHIDFLLVESCRKSHTGDFHLAQSDMDKDSTMSAILKSAQKKGIPTVFWNTQDSAYHEHYLNISKNFDYTFCSDPRTAVILDKSSLKADVLLPAVQPALFNPFNHYRRKKTFEINGLFDGLADLFKFGSDLSVLKEISAEFGLGIIDTNNLIFRNRIESLPEYRNDILGCVSYLEKVTILKHSKVSISFDLSLATPTTQAWMALESLACKVPVHHFGKLEKDDIRLDLVHQSTSQKPCLEDLVALFEDPQYRKRIAHISWRNVNSHHTFSHRVKQICQKLKIDHDWQEYPKVSLILPSYRHEILEDTIDTISKQDYPNKEIIVVFNGNKSSKELSAQIKNSQDVDAILTQPTDMFTGASMNLGLQKATGEYYFKIDDDDYYSKKYVSDMMLYIKAIDFDVLGKPPGYWLFENDNTLYCRQTPNVEHCKLPAQEVIDEKLRITGNTICGKIQSLKNIKWQDNVFGAADTGFLVKAGSLNLDIYSCDINNVVVSRRADGKSHTWRPSYDRLKKSSLFLSGINLESLLEL